MRSYAQVLPQFWTGDTGKKIRKLGRDAQVIALYLMTCPSSNMIGLYYLPMPVLCHETGIDQEGASKALTHLKAENFAHYDASEEVVWLPQMAKYQFGDSLELKDKRHKNISQEVAKYSKSLFFQCFMEKYGKAYNLIRSVRSIVKEEEISKPLGMPLGRGIRDHREEQEQEQEQEYIQGASPEDQSTLAGSDSERQAARRAFDQWSHVSRGRGLSVEQNEHTSIHALMATLAQGPPVIRGRESVPAHKLVAFAADAMRQEGKDFKGIAWACKCVKTRIEEWIAKGMPSSTGPPGKPKPFVPITAKT